MMIKRCAGRCSGRTQLPAHPNARRRAQETRFALSERSPRDTRYSQRRACRAERKKSKENIDPRAPNEHRCELLSGWIWARWDQITDWVNYGLTRPMTVCPCITGKNVSQ